MTTRGSALTRSLLLLALAGCGRCDEERAPLEDAEAGTTAAPTATSAKPSEPSTASEPSTLCQTTRDDNAVAMAKAAFGDVLVLRYTPGFRDHAAIAERALRAGAEAAEPMVSAPVTVMARDGLIQRTTAGLTKGDLGRLSRHLAAGRLPEAAGEIVLSKEDARILGIAVGDEITLAAFRAEAPEKGTNEPPNRKTAKLVGTFAADGRFGGDRSTVWTTIEGARALHPEHDGETATSVSVHLRAGTDPEAWKEAFQRDLGPEHRAMTSAELQEPLLQRRKALLSVCDEAPPPSRKPEPFEAAALVPRCDDRNAAETVRGLVRATYGDAAIFVSPEPGASLLALPWLPKAAEKRWSVALSAWIATQANAFDVEVGGLDDQTLASLRRHAIAGRVEDLAEGGVAVPAPVAKALGVGVGDEVLLGVTNPSFESKSHEPLARRVRVAALMAYPAPALGVHLALVIAHRDRAPSLHPHLDAGAGNSVSLWASSGDGAALRDETQRVAPVGAFVSQLAAKVETSTAATIRILDALCPP